MKKQPHNFANQSINRYTVMDLGIYLYCIPVYGAERHRDVQVTYKHYVFTMEEKEKEYRDILDTL